MSTADTVPAKARASRMSIGHRLIWIAISLSSVALFVGSLTKLLPFGLIEVFGFITGAVCVMLTVQENMWNWPLGLANNVFFIVLFLDQRLYADMALQFVYVVLGILGWYRWLFGGANRSRLKVSHVGVLEFILIVIIGAGATVGMTFFLRSVNDAAPFLDAVTTVLSLAAQYLLTRKAIENWFFWMTADVLYIGLYISKGLVLTAILYGLFLLLCCGGLLAWRRSLHQARAETQVSPA